MKWKKSDSECLLAGLAGVLWYFGAFALSCIVSEKNFGVFVIVLVGLVGILFPLGLFSYLLERMDKKRGSTDSSTGSTDDSAILLEIKEAVDSNEPPEAIKEQIQWLLKKKAS